MKLSEIIVNTSPFCVLKFREKIFTQNLVMCLNMRTLIFSNFVWPVLLIWQGFWRSSMVSSSKALIVCFLRSSVTLELLLTPLDLTNPHKIKSVVVRSGEKQI